MYPEQREKEKQMQLEKDLAYSKWKAKNSKASYREKKDKEWVYKHSDVFP